VKVASFRNIRTWEAEAAGREFSLIGLLERELEDMNTLGTEKFATYAAQRSRGGGNTAEDARFPSAGIRSPKQSLGKPFEHNFEKLESFMGFLRNALDTPGNADSSGINANSHGQNLDVGVRVRDKETPTRDSHIQGERGGLEEEGAARSVVTADTHSVALGRTRELPWLSVTASSFPAQKPLGEMGNPEPSSSAFLPQISIWPRLIQALAPRP
jgi:hypothetical protein